VKEYDLDEFHLTSTSFHYLFISVWPFVLFGNRAASVV